MRAAVMTFATIVALPLSTGAQASQNAQVLVQAQVQSVPLNVDVVGITDFGLVLNHSHEELIDPTAPSAQQSTAAITIGTAPFTQFLLTIGGACPTNLVVDDATVPLQFYHRFAGNPLSDVQANAVTLPECESQFSVEGLAPGPDPNLHYFYMWLGGRLVIDAGPPAGFYSGVVQITVEIL